jgi:hypothetical protein
MTITGTCLTISIHTASLIMSSFLRNEFLETNLAAYLFLNASDAKYLHRFHAKFSKPNVIPYHIVFDESSALMTTFLHAGSAFDRLNARIDYGIASH